MHEPAIAKIYRTHGRALRAHCQRLLGAAEDAGDALQEAFVRALVRDEPFAGDEHVVRFLYRTSTNLCIDVLRQQRVRQLAVPEIAARANRQERVEPRDDTRQHARRLLEACDDVTRTVAVLHFVHGMKQSEIGAQCGVSRRTVFNRLKRFQRLAADQETAAEATQIM